jgi:myosin heavy subunit
MLYFLKQLTPAPVYLFVCTAMGALGFDREMQTDIFGVTTAVLHASKLSFVAVTDDTSRMDESNPHLEPFLTLLGIERISFSLLFANSKIRPAQARTLAMSTRDWPKRASMPAPRLRMAQCFLSCSEHQ